MNESTAGKQVPSRVSVVVGTVFTAAVAAVTGWLAVEMTGTRDFIGFLFGLVIFGSLVVQTCERWAQRADAEVKRRREQAERDESNTGVWFGGDPGEIVTVRWDTASALYWVAGRRGGERPWDDIEALVEYLKALEDGGWSAGQDMGTRLIRATLDLPGWEYAP